MEGQVIGKTPWSGGTIDIFEMPSERLKQLGLKLFGRAVFNIEPGRTSMTTATEKFSHPIDAKEGILGAQADLNRPGTVFN